MMLRSCRVWSLAALLLAAVHAQEDSMPGEESGLEGDGLSDDALTEEQLQAMHGKIDSNSDSKVSMDEVMKFSDDMRKRIATKDIKTVLEEMDMDKDGKLSLDELIKELVNDQDMQNWGDGEEEDKKEVEARKDLETQKFKLADENKDGFVDLEELPAMFYPETHEGVLELTAKATMAQKDKNSDGFLTLSEFWEGDQGAEAMSEEMYIADEEKADFANLDRDKNEKLDLEELKEWESGRFHTRESMKKLFDMADADSDLHLTADELKGVREQLAGSDAQYHLMEWAEHHEL